NSSHSGGAPEAAFPSRTCCACGCTETPTAYLRDLTVTIEVRLYSLNAANRDTAHDSSTANPSYPAGATASHLARYGPHPARYDVKTRGLPGMFAPTYQESAFGNSVELATSDTCDIHARCASTLGSIVACPWSRSQTTQSMIHSTCCSMDTTMLENTDGDPGPVTMNMFGNPAAARPR